MIYDALSVPVGEVTMVHPEDHLSSTCYNESLAFEELLVPVFRAGESVGTSPSLSAIRTHAASQLASLDASHKRFLNPHTYKVGLEEGLSARRIELIANARTPERE
jgi:nicotinate phosphoribosyltransferase